MTDQTELVMCQVTSALFPINELVEAHTRDGFYGTQQVYIHPSVVDNRRLSNYVTTLNGSIWSRGLCHEAESPDGDTVYLSQQHNYDAGEYDYFICPDCGNMFHTDDSHYLGDNFDRTVCNSCIDNYTTCPDCGEYMEDDEEAYCGSCGYGKAEIHDYSYKPSPVFQGTATDRSPFIGFELEIEAKRGSIRDQAKECNSQFDEDDIFLKHDSSLSNGFEIVSHPFTLDIHKRKNYKPLLERLTKMGARSHNTSTCGLHFHLDKRSMTDSHKVRFGAFFALARHKLEVMARRTSEDYAAFKSKNVSLSEFIAEDSRYSAVNWLNRHTVEVRIFRGTLRYETFMANMQLCHAIYAFTFDRNSLNCEFEENAVWDKFRKFVSKHKARYAELISFMREKQELLDRAIQKDADIINLEKKRNVKRKKLRLTDNVINATLEQEHKYRRSNYREAPSFIYTDDENSRMAFRIVNDYNMESNSPVRIDLDHDYTAMSNY